MHDSIDIMVCVTRQRACERLIKRGVALKKEGMDMAVVHVARTGDDLMGNPVEGEALDILFSVSKANGAVMYMLRSDNVLATLEEFALEHHVKIIIMGSAPGDGGLETVLMEKLPDVEFHIVPA